MFYSIQFSDEFLFTTLLQIRIDLTQCTAQVLTCWLCWINMRCRLAQSAISWCIESTSWLMFMDWCIDVLVGVLNRHVGWRLLTDALTCLLGVESTCWLTFTDALTCLLVSCIDMFVDVYWCTDVLVGLLNRHVGWCLLVHWRVGYYAGSICCLHCFAQCNCCGQIVAFGYKKKHEKETICFTYSKLVENLHSAVAVRWHLKHSII